MILIEELKQIADKLITKVETEEPTAIMLSKFYRDTYNLCLNELLHCNTFKNDDLVLMNGKITNIWEQMCTYIMKRNGALDFSGDYSGVMQEVNPKLYNIIYS